MFIFLTSTAQCYAISSRSFFVNKETVSNSMYVVKHLKILFWTVSVHTTYVYVSDKPNMAQCEYKVLSHGWSI